MRIPAIPDALKSYFSPPLVQKLAADIAGVYPPFEAGAFSAEACDGLEGLELMERGQHIARALGRHLPESYPEAIAVLLRSLGPEHASDELLGGGMSSFYYLPHGMFVAERGLDHFDLSMHAQYELTKRFSAEFSIRSFLATEPERTMAVLEAWTRDANPHVRRLVSEGTRLRLPWARRVAWLDENPERIVALLERLKDDPATLVRRSVANNLNDMGKVHPELLVRTCQAWLPEATTERRRLIEHALRSAVKRGHQGALRVLGYGDEASVSVEDVRFEPENVAIGGKVRVSFTLRSEARAEQDLLVDLAVHFVKARGQAGRKVFKLKRVTLPPEGRMAFHATISLAVRSTRVPRPGRHAVDVLVNGAPWRAGSFEVLAAAP